MSARHASVAMQSLSRLVAAAAVGLVMSCNGEPSSSVSPRLGAPLGARATSDVVVSSAAPDSAMQDTTIDVTISGSGFTSDMVAQWALAGVADSAQVRTNKTKFVNSRTIVANITISATATAAKWDVVVMSKSKGGIGTELFTVKTNGNAKAISIPISAEVKDTGPAGANRIQSDGLGEYVNGAQGMTAEIDSYGNLQISPNNANSTTPPQRTLKFDFSAPIDPLNAYRPDESGQWNFKIKTTVFGNPRIQDLGVNGNPVSACYNATIAHENSKTHHRAIFNPSSDPMSTSAFITRTTASPATWAVVSDGPCPHPNAGGVWSQDLVKRNAPLVFRGYYDLRFSIVLRAK